MKCEKCKNRIGFFQSFFTLNNGKKVCKECYNNDKTIIQSLEREKQEEKAIEMLKERGIIVIDDETVSIDVSNTSIKDKIPKKHLDVIGHLRMKGIAQVKETGEEIPISKRLIDIIIENKFDKDEVDELVESFFEKQLINFEKEKIKERQKRLKIREKAEKELFGKNKKKRVALTEEEKEAILDKFHRECAACGTKEGLHIHHKDRNPSNNQIKNLSVLCGVCHKKVHMKVR